MNSGIYEIQNVINGKKYIGSAVDINKRWKKHLAMLRRGIHDNKHLQSTFDKYGEKVFMFDVLAFVLQKEDLIPIEQFFINALKPEYNIAPMAGSQLGLKHSKEAKRKISKAMKGKPSGMLGKHHSKETKRKMSEAEKGEKNHNYGKPLSEEAKRKLSEARKGENNPNYGKPLSEETKEKIRKALKKYWMIKRNKGEISTRPQRNELGTSKKIPIRRRTSKKIIYFICK